MSKKNELLYVKGMNISESDEEEGEEDIWDDSKINAAYDKAMKVANAEVAQRLAMATNSQTGDKDKGSATIKKSKCQLSKFTNPPNPQNPRNPPKQWEVGMPCRAVYEYDGLEYEALISRILPDNECVVQYLGYDNREVVKIGSLRPTLGKEACTLQIEVAATERVTSGGSCSTRRESMDVDSERDPSPGSTVVGSRKKKSSKKKSHNNVNNFELPDIPMPNFNNTMGNLESVEMPMPPPLSMSSRDIDTEDQAHSSMLLSWYMSGYYTGLYQGIKRGRLTRRDT